MRPVDVQIRRDRYKFGATQMPEPHSLKVGDLVRFVTLPDEWTRPSYTIGAESIAFMKKMIRRSGPSRVAEVDEDGYPWIRARIRERGRIHYHSWMITESTGWRLVKRRT
jgi:hypothetical protein